MPTVSGTSSVGYQVIMTSSSAPSSLLGIAFTDFPLPPPLRVGYFYLYEFATATPNQCQIVDRGAVYRPGILQFISVPLLGAGFAYRLDIDWNVNGLNYSATIA